MGTELAIYLAQLGRKVCIVEMAPALNSVGNILHQTALDLKIRELGIETLLGVRANSVRKDGVECEGGVFVPADTVVCAMGQKPLSEEAWSLRECAPQFFVIGDSVTPKNIMQATAMADAAVADIF